MILDRKIYKLIESHFKSYTADKSYVAMRTEEIAENITSVPGGSNKSGHSDPTLRKAIRIEAETGEIQAWLDVVEATEKYFDEQAMKEYGKVETGKGEYIRLLYFQNKSQFRVTDALDISEGTFWNWRKDILNRAAIYASARGLIE